MNDEEIRKTVIVAKTTHISAARWLQNHEPNSSSVDIRSKFQDILTAARGVLELLRPDIERMGL